MLQLKNKKSVWVVTGSSGTGKSSYAVLVLGNGNFTCRFIFDPRDDEMSLRFRRRSCHVPAELNAAISTGWVIFNPHTMFPGDPQKGLEKFAEWAWVKSGAMPGQKVFYCDEVWKYCSPHFIPKPLAVMLMDGRKSGIGTLLTTHSPHRMNAVIIGEATELISFQLRGELKLDYLRKNCDEFPVDKLKDLPSLHYIAMNLDSGGTATGVIKF